MATVMNLWPCISTEVGKPIASIQFSRTELT